MINSSSTLSGKAREPLYLWILEFKPSLLTDVHYLWQLWEWGGVKEGHTKGREKEKRSTMFCLRCAQIMEIWRVSLHMKFLSFPQIQTCLLMSGWVTVRYSEDALTRVVCAACFWQERKGGDWRSDGRTLASAFLFNCLAVCTWLEWISAQRGAPGPCQERWLFSNGVWQAEESRAGVTHMLLSGGKALTGVSATATPSALLFSFPRQIAFQSFLPVSRTDPGKVREKNMIL